jgi:hypothetical protein
MRTNVVTALAVMLAAGTALPPPARADFADVLGDIVHQIVPVQVRPEIDPRTAQDVYGKLSSYAHVPDDAINAALALLAGSLVSGQNQATTRNGVIIGVTVQPMQNRCRQVNFGFRRDGSPQQTDVSMGGRVCWVGSGWYSPPSDLNGGGVLPAAYVAAPQRRPQPRPAVIAQAKAAPVAQQQPTAPASQPPAAPVAAAPVPQQAAPAPVAAPSPTPATPAPMVQVAVAKPTPAPVVQAPAVPAPAPAAAAAVPVSAPAAPAAVDTPPVPKRLKSNL